MQDLDFDHFQVGGWESYPCSDDYTDELPILLMPDRESFVLQAGFDPATTGLVRILSRRWRNHPSGSVLVAHNTNFPRGSQFAVSKQPVRIGR